MKKIIATICFLSLMNFALFAQNTISGQVNCLNGGGMEGVTVELNGGSMGTISMMTDASGNYAFDNISSGEDYTLHVEMDGEPVNGVSTFDLVLVMQEILNPPFDNPFLHLAADVNGSGSVTTLDLVWMRKMILALEDIWPVNIWRFATDDYSISPAAGYVDDVPVTNLQGDLSVNFVGVHTGDMNGSANGCN